ncbi:hypothetical protein KW882_00795 [Vibrio parahaemolyticus]
MTFLDALLDKIASSDTFLDSFSQSMEKKDWGLVHIDNECLDFIASETYATEAKYREESTLDALITLNLPECGNKELVVMVGYNVGEGFIPFGYTSQIEYKPEKRLRVQIENALQGEELPTEHKELLNNHQDSLSALLSKVDEAQDFIESQNNLNGI